MQFFLVGNGPYANHGCEAIVRGTTRILDAAFGDQTRYLAASFGAEAQIAAQAASETFTRLRHEELTPKGRANVDYLKHLAHRLLGVKSDFCLCRVPPEAKHCRAALQIGGDNYSLDYGYPRVFMQIDRWLQRRGVPVVLWGASVGPFDRDPWFERQMKEHLSGLALITVRESRSYRYLEGLGLTNIAQVADPAFLMEPEAVAAVVLPPAFLGLNLSPLTARYATGGDLDKWCGACAVAVAGLLSRCDLPVVLIPHVVTPIPQNDDHAFHQAVARGVQDAHRITVLGANYSAAQLKWVIGKATVFAGARTHSTIASISMGVPTLSLAYSVKAWGINEDVFGHAEHCMKVSDLLQEDALAGRMAALLQRKDALRQELRLRVPTIQAEALSAGTKLRECLKSRT